MLTPKQWSILWGGRTLMIEVGKLALQANGSCTVRYGDTVMMATAMKSENVRADIDYFPLMVDFEEKLYAAGKIKGSRFVKREGRPSDDAIISARLIDRAIRPLFDDRVRNDVQVIVTPLAVDGENDSAFVGLIAASTALSISSIPWDGPIAGARIGRKENGECILNITNTEMTEGASSIDLLVAGTPERLIMVEAGAKEVEDMEFFRAMKWGCAELGPVVALIKQVQKEVGKTKDSIADFSPPQEGMSLEEVRSITKKFVADHADTVIFNTPKVSKGERTAMIDAIKKSLGELFVEKNVEETIQKIVMKEIKEHVAHAIGVRILDKNQRLDGRSLIDIRELLCNVDVLPRVHGSALFMRGDTQVLSIVTLGAPGDVQTLDSMEEEGEKRYMHHYNDAPYSYGEVKPMRGPSRRSIGHGALAERALEPVLPEELSFPYAIRVVSEVLGSNGSSSMASTCASSLSLMAAGVPIKKPVAGIAMGLASDEAGRFRVLTDLQDVEDGKGGMDFKIAGTRDGITAAQMDTKTKGLTWDIVEQIIAQAERARVEILSAMDQAIAAPREDLSPYAPRIETVQIDPERIGDVIGPQGKIIKKIIEDTGVQIDIEQDGRVLVTSNDAAAMEKAIAIIKELTHEISAGEEYEGTVVRLEDFGAFVQILPNKDGLVHVSEIAWERTNRPSDVMKIGDKVRVLVKEIDQLGRVNLSMKALKPKPVGYVPPEPRDRSGPHDRRGGFRPGGRGGHGFGR